MKELETKSLYKTSNTSVAFEFIQSFKYPWQIIPLIESCILDIGKTLSKDYYRIGESIWISKSAKIEKSASIDGPCIICENAEIRHSAYIRKNVIVGRNCVVGNSTELKNCILFDNVQAPHYNYVGDSILGYKSHLGAGAIISNLKGDKSEISIKYDEKTINTGLKKLGAMVGDFVEIGCGSVLNPGAIIGVNTNIYPLSSVRGCLSSNLIYKAHNCIIKKEYQ